MPDTQSACRLPRGAEPEGLGPLLASTQPARRAQLARLLALGAALVAGLPAAVHAQGATLARPGGKVILTLSGKIDKTNAPGKAEFDMAMLEALPQHSFTTSTPWFKTPRKFTGPLLRDVLDAVGAKGSKLRAVALNDYKVDLPADDTRQWGVVLARLLDDAPMPVREKGPLFIIYPFDEDTTLRSERYYSRCAWQLKSLLVD
jgi:hypothetical protein